LGLESSDLQTGSFLVTFDQMQGKGADRPTSRQGEFEIDVELLAFAHRYATGPVKWDILVFFGENPYSRDTASSIAQRIGRRVSTVARELHDLSLMGVLERQRMNGNVVFMLSPSPKIRRTLSRFVATSRGGDRYQ